MNGNATTLTLTSAGDCNFTLPGTGGCLDLYHAIVTVIANAAQQVFREQGLVPQAWSNRPGTVYEWHAHPYQKLLICTEGSITFHTRTGDVVLAPGDRLDLPAGTDHAATVGPLGVTCLEASC